MGSEPAFVVQRLEGGSGLPLLPHVQTAELPARGRVPKDTLEADMQRGKSGEEVKVPLPGGGRIIRARAEDEAVANRPSRLSRLPRGPQRTAEGGISFKVSHRTDIS